MFGKTLSWINRFPTQVEMLSSEQTKERFDLYSVDERVYRSPHRFCGCEG